jgi:hypothetical protein
MNNCGLPVDLFRFASLSLALDRASPPARKTPVVVLLNLKLHEQL